MGRPLVALKAKRFSSYKSQVASNSIIAGAGQCLLHTNTVQKHTGATSKLISISKTLRHLGLKTTRVKRKCPPTTEYYTSATDISKQDKDHKSKDNQCRDRLDEGRERFGGARPPTLVMSSVELIYELREEVLGYGRMCRS